MSKIANNTTGTAWNNQWINQTNQTSAVYPPELYQCPKGHQQDGTAIARLGARACEQCCKEWLAQMFPTTQIAPCPECGSGFLNKLRERWYFYHNEGCTIDAIERAAAEP